MTGPGSPVVELTELIALRATAQGLMLDARRRAREMNAGVHTSLHRGRGLEFQEVRQYVPGDDPRSIDWRVTARRGRPHTKLFREERERPVWLLVDLDPALYFGTRRQLKSAAILRAAALLAWTAALRGDRVGAAVAGAQETRLLPPRSNDAGVLPLLAALCELQPRAPGRAAAPPLASALRALAPFVRSGTVVLILSDFAGLEGEPGEDWSVLVRRSACRLFRVVDPIEELGLPNGLFRAGMPDRVRLLDGAGVRASWLEAWRERESRVEALARLLAAPVVRLDTADTIERALAGELSGRKTGTGRPGARQASA